MTVEQIAARLNEKASEEGFQIANLPELRKKHLNKERLPGTIFTQKTIFDNYAFHHGGRDELQFNFGRETVEGKTVTRYGLCISVQFSPSLHNPIEKLLPYRKSFDACFEAHPEFFRNFEMWYYEDGFRHRNVRPGKIPDTWFQEKNFIVLGKLIGKPLTKLNEEDLKEILLGFDQLMPIYRYCVLERTPHTQRQTRIARLCWNLNGWVMPSGAEGKSKDRNSHECQYGFGHEEWLLDVGKLIDGYHYAFLEPIRKAQNAFERKRYDVRLYSIDGVTRKRYMIGTIKNVEVIDSSTAVKIKQKYIALGWLDEMKQQLKTVGAKPGNLETGGGIDIFNVRFRPIEMHIKNAYQELGSENPLRGISRYVFARDRVGFSNNQIEEDFQFQPRSSLKDTAKVILKMQKRLREPVEIEISNLHAAISDALTKHFDRLKGWKNVTPEHRVNQGASRIDIVVKHGNDLIFYEIKTYNSLRTSIREAIGQLLEYSHWTSHNRANRMIVVTQQHSDISDAKKYFKHLREKYGLPIYFQTYEIQQDILSEEL